MIPIHTPGRESGPREIPRGEALDILDGSVIECRWGEGGFRVISNPESRSRPS